MRSDEVVADTNAVPIGVVSLDDRSLERAVLPTVGKIDEIARKENVSLIVAYLSTLTMRTIGRDNISAIGFDAWTRPSSYVSSTTSVPTG
jgi:hypothetical protein